MNVTLNLEGKMRFKGVGPVGEPTYFDTHPVVGGEDTASTPMEIMLKALGACSGMDIVSIIRKKRKQVIDLEINIQGDRGEMHPRVFTAAHIKYKLVSPDAVPEDMERALALSQGTYCSVSAMFRAAGCDVTWEYEIVRP